MKKYVKHMKRIIALLVIVVLNIHTFATSSSNDGSQFVTKADFDSLVTDFNKKMNEYQSGLNAKIDNAVANYIAGMSAISTQNIDTGIDIECAGGATLRFIKKDADYLSMTNDPYGKDYIFNFAGGTYATEAVFAHDCYDTYIFTGEKENGNKTNYIYLLDANGCISEKRQNCAMIVERTYIFYSTTNATHGLLWRSASQTLNTPTEIYSSSNAFINETIMKGYAFKQSTSASGPGSPWSTSTGMWARFRNNYDTTTHNTTNSASINQTVWRTGDQTFNLNNITRQTVVSIIGTKQSSFVDHWQLGSNNGIKTTTAEWGSKDMIAAANSSRVAYTATNRLRATSGPGCALASKINPSITGYGVKFNYTAKSPSQVYYQGIYSNWDSKKLGAAGGFPFLYHKKDGTVTVSLTLSTATTICFTTAQNTTFPTSGSADLVTFEYQPAGAEYIKTTNPVLLGAGTYSFKVPVANAKPVFLNADWATTDDYLTIKQVGTAKISFNS